ncbi:TRAP transporter large permease [Rhodobacteraceae bacterium RKSG542]|uniref:TRAP transporter large permease n=1 Tax=Pseudovibrio flavus TaxID=2529854 RepID=UPI0012BD4B65|nr:TRAP transporter large permease [Pseudovibrio flavus]MTI17963.1 TRAP transporter large permease [Pseudovibrio flavus]
MFFESAFILFGLFVVLVTFGVPISFAIGLATAACIAQTMNPQQAAFIVAQRIGIGLDSFTLLAIPFFILAGNIMNRGGIARRMIEFAKVLAGRLPGALAHCNILANMMFGSISGSAVAAAAAVGGIMSPLQKKEGYDPAFSAAVNAASCPTGSLIPPSAPLIVYSLVSGGTSVATLFVAGYIPGVLMGVSAMVVATIIAKKRGYPLMEKPTFKEAVYKAADAILPLLLVVIIMGGIVGGLFTATEASAVAVAYTFLLAVFLYKEVKLSEVPAIIQESAVTTAIVLLLIGCSIGMSWAMAFSGMPQAFAQALLTVSDSPLVIMLLINLTLLFIGVFMDLTPAMLIFTPIFLPAATELGMDPVHFGIMMTFNLCIGVITPPVGSSLFVACSVGGVAIKDILKPMIPFYAGALVVLALVTMIPDISLFLPRLLLGYTG